MHCIYHIVGTCLSVRVSGLKLIRPAVGYLLHGNGVQFLWRLRSQRQRSTVNVSSIVMFNLVLDSLILDCFMQGSVIQSFRTFNTVKYALNTQYAHNTIVF
jgi:hypothetical protein